MSIYKSIHPKSTRTVLVEQSPYTEGVRLEVSGTNRSGRTVSEARVILPTDRVVELALDLLKRAGREDLLAKPVYVPLAQRVGQYVQQVGTNLIVRITGEYKDGYFPNRDYATGVNERGGTEHIFNDLTGPDGVFWTPVDVKVTPAQPEKWEVAE